MALLRRNLACPYVCARVFRLRMLGSAGKGKSEHKRNQTCMNANADVLWSVPTVANGFR
jgi:hypothetical protein